MAMARPTQFLRGSIGAMARREFRELVTIHPSDRPWQLPFAVAVAAGLPMLLGAWFGEMSHMSYAALASVGAMAIVHVPSTRLDHRMAVMMAVAFAMIACHAFGQLSQFAPLVRAPVITLVAVFATMACRYYRVGPPGSLFFVLAAAIGAYAPGDAAHATTRLGVFALGSIGAVIVAFLYSLHILRSRAPSPMSPPPPPQALLDSVVIDSLLVGLFVGLSLGAAQLLGLEKPYWVPVSCLAVIQGVNLRAVWNRQAHRILGTMIGLAATWMLARYAAGPWTVAVAITVLTFCVEAAIVRHYGFAVVLVTPLTILLAEVSTLGHAGSSMLIAARFADTVLGSLLGLAGGFCLHHAVLRRWLRQWLGGADPSGP